MTAPSTAEATQTVAALAGLEGAGLVLDDAALSALMGHRAVIEHVRLKVGRSIHVAWRAADGSPTPDWGWAEVTKDPHKADKAVLRAELAGENVQLQRVGSSLLLWGGLRSDRALGKHLLSAREALGEEIDWRVLRYNPGKRVVAAVDAGSGPAVLRVSTGTDNLVDASRRWAEAGVPTLVPETLGSRGTASLTPWWGSGDLHTEPLPAAALAAGRRLGTLHARTQGMAWQPETPPESRPDATAAGLLESAPWEEGRIRRIADRLSPLFDELGRSEPSWLHGDLSPDQVLHDGSAGIRVVDLDRARSGPAVLDVGSWLAACAAEDLSQLVEPFLAGHAESMGPPDLRRLTIAEAIAQFRAAIDPFRKLLPDWPVQLATRLELTEQALGRLS
ncbi:hypothetical protein GCM10028820_10760 [Tessaracoccus terricola]